MLTKLYTGVYRQNEDGETDFYGQIEIDKYEQASIDRMVKEADEDEEDEDDAPIENEFKGAKSTR